MYKYIELTLFGEWGIAQPCIVIVARYVPAQFLHAAVRHAP